MVSYDVVSNADSGPGTLRDAITQANLVPGQIDIAWGGQVPDRIELVTPLPRLESNSVINGYFQLGNQNPTRGVEIDGALLTGPNPIALRLGSNCEVRGIAISNVRNASGEGVGLRLEGSGNVVEGVYLGTDITGTIARGNDTGLVVTGSNNQIGDPSLVPNSTSRTRVLASGNGVGIAVVSDGSATGNVIRRASIGLDVAGRPLPNASHGIRIVDAPDTRIGGLDVLQRVTIAFNGGDGVRVEGASSAVSLRQNPIHSNGGLALDLAGDGVTANDAGDVDTGPNGLQNHPVIDTVVPGGGAVVVSGDLDSRPNTAYLLDFYANGSADPSGHGEAEALVGTTSVTTDGAGHAAFAVGLFGVTTVRPFVSATATDPAGNTSELAASVQATGLPAQASFTVNVTDNLEQGVCSPQRCSLNEALSAANRTPNGPQPDLIGFDVPGPGVATIHVLAADSTLPVIATEAVIVDGYTQPGSSPNTIPSGAGGLDSVLRVEIVGDGSNRCLIFEGGGSVVRGLAVSACGAGIRLAGDGNVAEGNYVGTLAGGEATAANFAGIFLAGSNNRVGGTSPAARNLISGNDRGISIGGDRNDDNLIQGNLIGTQRDGHAPLGNGWGIYVTPDGLGGQPHAAHDTLIGGAQPGAQNVIAASASSGIRLDGIDGEITGTRIEGNFIGVDAEGDDFVGNAIGVWMSGVAARDNVLGGSGAGEGNLVSGNAVAGVFLARGTHDNRIEGNRIGPSLGTAAAAGLEAILVIGANDNRIVGNTIRGATRNGIVLVAEFSDVLIPATGNLISANSIGGNGLLAIDLVGDGVTPNDPGDVDTDVPNELQNFPTITNALPGGFVSGVFSGAPGAQLVIEFFGSASLSAGGFSQAETYLGSQTILTDASGNASFSTVVAPFPAGQRVSATASFGRNTSELGPAFVTPSEAAAGELSHGVRQERALGPARGGAVVYAIAQAARSSYEVVVDATSGAAAPVVLERLDATGAVLQSSAAAGAGGSARLRWENASTSAVYHERIRVHSAGCTSTCGAGDRYRVRAYDTTLAVPRFNNSGTQRTVMLLQNPASAAVSGHWHFWAANGDLLRSESFTVAAKGLSVLDVAALLPGATGSVTLSHDGSYGALAGKAVLLEPATGFSFDSQVVPRGR